MLLTLDIGNTNIKSALFTDQSLKEFFVHSDEGKVFEYLNKISFTEAAICSVNPRVDKLIVDNISLKDITIFRANIQNKFIFKISYETPETLGLDRVCSAAGAMKIADKKELLKKKQYLVTIDFGTATTINIVSPSREFIGGLIAPGITTMIKSLNEKTAQLPLPDLNFYKGVIGNSTYSSIISGVMTSTLGMITETINHLTEISNQNMPILFATGGNAKHVLPHLKFEVLFDEALVLKGLKKIYDLNKS